MATMTIIGAAAWAAFIAVMQPGWSPALFLLAPTVIIPLTLALLPASMLPRAKLVPLLLTASLLVMASFLFQQGWLAAALAVPWLGLTVWLAWRGLLGLRRGRNPWICCGLLYVTVGGGWLVLARFGARPLDYADVIVQATATHFHFAGLALGVLAGLTVERLSSRWTRALAWWLVAGVSLVAVGITMSALGTTWFEPLAAWFLAIGCTVFAVVQGRVAMSERGLAGILLGMSSLALTAAMVLASLYGARLFWDLAWLDIPTMLRYHGSLQALGFALLGLLGWHTIKRVTRPVLFSAAARET